ncbi:MAG: hypothetical protein IKI75_03795 [Lachnospiraceae bacterium]|nr:hypothetical protein [Lachnospiraceae bacterium]
MEIAVIPKGMLPPMGTGPLDESLVRELFGEKTDVQGSTPCAKKQEPEIQITGYPGKVVTELPKIVKKEPSASEYAKNGWIRTESGQIRIKEEPKPDMKLVIDTALPLLLRCDKAGLENDHLGCEDVQGPYWNIEDETGLEWYKADRNADISEVLESLISMLDWMKGNAVNELYFVAPRYSIGVHFRTAEKYILFWNIDKIDHKKKNELRMIIRRSGHNIMLYNRYFRRDLLTGDEYIYEGGRRMLDVDVYEYCIRKIKRVVLL